jgi:hypothetical protein
MIAFASPEMIGVWLSLNGTLEIADIDQGIQKPVKNLSKFPVRRQISRTLCCGAGIHKQHV